MRKIAWILTLAMFLTMLAGCTQQAPEQNQTPKQDISGTPNETPDETPEQTPVDNPADKPEDKPEDTPEDKPEETPDTGVSPAALVGTWTRTHAEIEGDKTKNTKGTITISGTSPADLTFTFKDKESSNFNAKEKSLKIKDGELFADCGNDSWYAKATSGKNTYELTLLEDGTLLMQLTFDFDGQPMVSTQWFARSK